MAKKILLSAFGIYMGGGAVLLKALLPHMTDRLAAAALDARLPRDTLEGATIPIQWVPKSFSARLRAVNRLARQCGAKDVLFCFNSLPPTVKCSGRVIVYVHAPHFVGLHAGIRYDTISQLRFMIERRWFRAGAPHVDEFWVQTPSMQRGVLGSFPQSMVRILPFVDDELAATLRAQSEVEKRTAPPPATYLYPADGVGHKNHVVLLQAWKYLAEQYGERCPQLLLTLKPESLNRALVKAGFSQIDGVVNLGPLSREAVLQRLQSATALIFPSRAETFGLPLLEATAARRPILASERDFSRDVCIPTQTFDPESAISIARAVERHLGVEPPLPIYLSAEEVIREIVISLGN